MNLTSLEQELVNAQSKSSQGHRFFLMGAPQPESGTPPQPESGTLLTAGKEPNRPSFGSYFGHRPSAHSRPAKICKRFQCDTGRPADTLRLARSAKIHILARAVGPRLH